MTTPNSDPQTIDHRSAVERFLEILSGAPTEGTPDASTVQLMMPDAVRLQLIASMREILRQLPSTNGTAPKILNLVDPILQGQPDVLAERYYRLVSRHANPNQTIPWDKLPGAHRMVFLQAMRALMRGDLV